MWRTVVSCASCCLFLVAVRPSPAAGQPSDSIATSVLTREDAIALALQDSPSLAAARAGVGAAAGRREQAGARSNPGLSLEVEQLSGSAPGEYTVRGVQRFELGGKPGARRRLAGAEFDVAALTAAAESVAVRTEVLRRYASAQIAAAGTALARHSVLIHEEIAEAVANKVRAGAVSPAESARAGVERAIADLELGDAIAVAGLAERRLASLWGASSLGRVSLTSIPESLPPVPARESLARRVLAAPSLRVLEARVEAAGRNAALQQTLGSPDFDLGAGVRVDRATGEETLVASLSLPLPLFDRNAGSRAAAAAEHAQARATLDLAVRQLERAVDESWTALGRARSRRRTLEAEVLPRARRAYEELLAGYRRGRFSFLDVHEARHELLAVARSSLEAYAEYSAAEATLASLFGGVAPTSDFDTKD